jgi:hypothetical protein
MKTPESLVAALASRLPINVSLLPASKGISLRAAERGREHSDQSIVP